MPALLGAIGGLNQPLVPPVMEDDLAEALRRIINQGGGSTPGGGFQPHPTLTFRWGRSAEVPTTEAEINQSASSHSLPATTGSATAAFGTGNAGDHFWLAVPSIRLPHLIRNADFLSEDILSEATATEVGDYTVYSLSGYRADAVQNWRITW